MTRAMHGTRAMCDGAPPSGLAPGAWTRAAPRARSERELELVVRSHLNRGNIWLIVTESTRAER